MLNYNFKNSVLCFTLWYVFILIFLPVFQTRYAFFKDDTRKPNRQDYSSSSTLRFELIYYTWLSELEYINRPRRTQLRRDLQSKGTGQKQKATTSTQIQSKRRREKEQRPCICVLGISILSFSAISILEFETVPTVWYFFLHFIASKISFLISL